MTGSEALERSLAQKEQEKIEKACEIMALEYETCLELKEWNDFVGDCDILKENRDQKLVLPLLPLCC